MAIKTSELKNLVWDILTFTDEVEEDGARVPRKTYSKKHFRGVKQLKSALLAQVEVGLLPKDRVDQVNNRWLPKPDVKSEEITWVKPTPGEKADENMVAITERHDSEVDIELSEKAKKALKFYYGEREELIDTTADALDELEKLLDIAVE